MQISLDRAERDVEQQSAALKKPLALRDLVLTQILFVVGSSWVGTAAKLGQAHLFFWLLAILLFYIPQAVVVIYLSNRMPLEGGIYQWAKLAFNEFAGFMVAWNLWLLSIMVIAMGGMFVTTNISYAIGDNAAWMPHSKWCVSLVSSAIIAGLGWIAVRGLSLGKWVHNIGGFTMLAVYAALIALPFIALMRGDLKEYHPLVLAAPTMSMFYCINISTKLAIGGLSGFEYVAILAGETRSPARDIGRSVVIASPVIALAFILGTSSVLAFVGDKPIDLIGPVPQTLNLGLRFSSRRRHCLHRHYFDDRENDRFHKRPRHRKFTIANGRRLGLSAAPLVLASASEVQNAHQLRHFRQRPDAHHCHRKPDRRRHSGSISTGGQRFERFLRNCLHYVVCDSDLWRRRDSYRGSDLVANRCDLRRCRIAIGDFLHDLSHHRCSQSLEFRRQNCSCDSNRECDWGRDLPGW